jgi:hypothetical protein
MLRVWSHPVSTVEDHPQNINLGLVTAKDPATPRREDRELVTNARCIAEVDDKV